MSARPPKAWRGPTRRSFVALLGAGLAAVVTRAGLPRAAAPDEPDARDERAAGAATDAAPRTIWIGHC